MSISPERQIYKCFVCGNGGNVFTFVQNFEKVSFVEAVEKVAELTGFHLSSKPAISKVEVDPHKKTLYDVLNETINYTMYQLDTSVALHAKEYLEKRGIDAEVRKEFQIGYDPDRTSVTKFLMAKGFEESMKELEEVVAKLESGDATLDESLEYFEIYSCVSFCFELLIM